MVKNIHALKVLRSQVTPSSHGISWKNQFSHPAWLLFYCHTLPRYEKSANELRLITSAGDSLIVDLRRHGYSVSELIAIASSLNHGASLTIRMQGSPELSTAQCIQIAKAKPGQVRFWFWFPHSVATGRYKRDKFFTCRHLIYYKLLVLFFGKRMSCLILCNNFLILVALSSRHFSKTAYLDLCFALQNHKSYFYHS